MRVQHLDTTRIHEDRSLHDMKFTSTCLLAAAAVLAVAHEGEPMDEVPLNMTTYGRDVALEQYLEHGNNLE